MKKLLFVFLISWGVIINAQSQITSSDVANIFAPGKAWVSTSSDDPQVTMDIGSASGTAQSWAVPNIAWGDTITMVNVAPANTPYFSVFPTATHCQSVTGVIQGYTGSSYSYFRLDNNSLYELGTVAHVQIGSIDTVVVLPSEKLLYSFPVTFGTTTPLSSDTSELGGGAVIIETSTESVDAFGNITMPFGTYPALRVTDNTESKTYFNGTLISQSSQLSFSWIAKDAGILQVDIDTSTGKSGTVALTYAELTQFTNAPSAVSENELITPSSFFLYQNYPNPFNPSTKIQYTIPAAASNNLVTLKVYDVLGNEIATLVNEVKPAGTYDVEFSSMGSNGKYLPSGIYIYKLTAGSFAQTKKMILLK
jgi:hypothetical protein